MATETSQAGTVGANAPGTNESGESTPQVDAAGNIVEAPPAGNNDGGNGDGGRSIESLPKWAQDEIRNTRAEAAKRRVEAKNAAEQARLEALNETDRKVEEAKIEIRKESDARVLKSAARGALAEAKIVNPAKSIALLDMSGVTLDDDGEPVGLDVAVAKLKEEFPNLVEGSTTDPALGNRPPIPSGKSMNDIIRGAVGR